jgi:hypothetical protein
MQAATSLPQVTVLHELVRSGFRKHDLTEQGGSSGNASDWYPRGDALES